MTTQEFEALYPETLRFLKSVACKQYGAMYIEAEELAQAALVRAFEKLSQYQGRGFKSWCVSIMFSIVANNHRRHEIVSRNERKIKPLKPQVEMPWAFEYEFSDFVQNYLQRAQRSHPIYADVLRRIYLEGSTVAEVASELGISKVAVRVRMLRARRWFRREVLKQGDTAPVMGLDAVFTRSLGVPYQGGWKRNTGQHSLRREDIRVKR